MKLSLFVLIFMKRQESKAASGVLLIALETARHYSCYIPTSLATDPSNPVFEVEVHILSVNFLIYWSS